MDSESQGFFFGAEVLLVIFFYVHLDQLHKLQKKKKSKKKVPKKKNKQQLNIAYIDR